MAEPMHVVVRPLDNPLIDAAVCEAPRSVRKHPDREKGCGPRDLSSLTRNEAVGVLIDQNVLPDEGVFVDFFGMPACAGTHSSESRKRTGAAVIPGLRAMVGSREALYPALLSPAGIHRRRSGRYAIAPLLIWSRVIREYPDQWFWIHRRWKTRPPGEAPFY